MADKRITDMGAPTGGVASGDKVNIVDVSDTSENAAGSSRADTLANIVTKGHGLANGVVKVASGEMVPATPGTDFYAPGSTDVAVADGGTGSSTAGGARTNLGVVPGVDVQAYNARLADIAGITFAQGDILYHNGSNIVKLAAGSAGQFLATQGAGANPSWASGALATYACIVAPSGGNYTSLSAALTAGETRIFVRNGTYTETTTMAVPANAQIIGESYAAIINLSTSGHLNMTGAGAQLRNIKVNFTGSGTTVRVNANDILIDGVWFDHGTLTNGQLSLGQSTSTVRTRITNCYFDKTNSSGTVSSFIGFSGSNNSEEVIIANNVVRGYFSVFVTLGANNAKVSIMNNSILSSTTASGAIISGSAFNGNGVLIANNNVNMTGSSVAITLSCSGVMVTGNTFINGGTSASTVQLSGSGNVVNGNAFTSGSAALTLGGTGNVVSGNTFTSCTTGISTTSANQAISGNTFVGVTTPINTGTALGINSIGNTGVDVLNTKVSVLMKNTSGGSITAGSLVTQKAVAAGNEVTTTTTASDPLVLGMLETTVANNASGNVLVKGKTVLLKVDGTTDIAVGDFITTFTTAGIGKKAATGDTAIAIALEAYTTDDSNGVIDALIITPRKI